ncbi:lateral organ boundaries domain-containing protein [Cynara cardunculus var. scolymus]|uniref:Lateral organ boundaries domain-containing protein n=2 Tax=Cynara cardunculus var. scolymus TaxID=59895 RepID=A0A103XXR9_CYNCS|nr:lateral organ boundaries domain-containing protein [Cynara cardunculus var. scolymus]
MTLKGGTSQACAACKYQRKRCTPECALAPHFRPEHTEIFKNAHKLFGVRKILRILEKIDPSQKTEAMRSIIYQANMRDRFPVHGCLGEIYHLQYQIRQAEKELYAVLSHLHFYKQQSPQQEITIDSSPESQLGMGLQQSAANGLTLFQHQQQFLPVAPFFDQSYNNNNHSGIHFDSMSNTGNDGMWLQQTYCNQNDGKTLVALQSQLLNTQPWTIQEEVTHDYDEIYPFFDTIDDTQSYIDSKDANESSSESSLKETTQSVQHVAGNKLKRAELQLGIVSEDYQATV